ncbi:hypothetical protein AvCA_26590 [Azotobacter vinelandii CA]|uniref:DUF3592 domain-containing protein n=2 Tax=Azotobacter vinelandii TaxID=354 RepID=C1DJR6_AZOVD|nr:hypothetical protein Avin_26590 [Azotobacter vinelandii DJ]AGK16591.1 hypothetical protein AvCA_26590 [Azotobacter vinelandii CA]AGK20787.1 hypothetical protein AvCA6_26590 [Azotobacter vinelandii CA6]
MALFIVGLVVFGVWTLIQPIMQLDDTYAELLENGQAVEGRVVAIEPTDVLLDNQPVSRFTVTYAQEGGERRAVFEQRVPFTDLPRVQPGAAVPLRLGADGKTVIDLQRLNVPLEEE